MLRREVADGAKVINQSEREHEHQHIARLQGIPEEDVRKVGLFNNLEIMVHPDYDRDGKLVDRTDEADGYAVGEPLVRPAGEYEFIGYIEL